MPLPLPNLDNRRWADLVDEGRSVSPRYASSWTDHNIHDPGITLVELFAWLTEMNLYRLNQVPDRHRRKFLSLIGFNPWPPQAAQTVLTFSPDADTGPFLLPAGAEFEAAGPDEQPIQFRTRRDIDVTAVSLAAIQVEAINAEGEFEVRDHTRDWRDGLPIAALGQNPRPGAALYLGFDELPNEVPLALAFHFQGPGSDADERTRIVHEAAAQGAACRHVLPDITCEEEAGQPQQPAEALPLHHSARVVWEVFSGEEPDPWAPLEPVVDLARPEVGQVRDDTRSLTLAGIVEVNLPSTMEQAQLGEVPDRYFYLRCRLLAGTYDAPPILQDVAPNSVPAEQAVPVWQTFPIATEEEIVGPIPEPGTTTRLYMTLDESGAIRSLTFDPSAPDWPDTLVLDFASPDDGPPALLTLEMVQVGAGTAQPDQTAMLPQAPVQIESLRLWTLEDGAWQAWARRGDLDASGRTDRHFVLDATRGEITFGDGERGRVPAAGALMLATYRTTRADQGNVAAARITRPADTPYNALWQAGLPEDVQSQLSRITTNRRPAGGGAAAERLAQAIGRVVETLYAHERLLELCAETRCQTLDQVNRFRVRALRPPTRAVNLLDLERLALDVPGTRVARARAWAELHPDYPCLQAPGVVTLVIVPDTPVARPEPSQDLLDVVRRYLDCWRLVTTRIEVVGPQYLAVRVQARVQTRPYSEVKRVKEQIVTALNAFLDPRSGGPDGLGWPFGRDVYRSEILQVIDGVAGVDHVLELLLSGGHHKPRCGNLSLCPTWLVTPDQHQIEVVRGSR